MQQDPEEEAEHRARDESGAIPAALTSFVGRKRERSRLEAWLRQGRRLITVLGPPGVGKTRLVRETAHALMSDDQAERDVVWVELSGRGDPDDVVAAAAGALGVVHTDRNRQRAVEGVGEALVQRGRLLLVLDNAEQAAEVVAELLSVWLRRAPHLSGLVTSRIRLRLPGEQSLILRPLELPTSDTLPEQLLECPSVRLFWERARALQPDFTLEGQEAAMVSLARQLDGLPLALELAAARTPLLNVTGLLDRLERTRMLLPDGEGSGTAEYPAGLWDAIRVSWELLDPDQQRTLAECAVFEPGFDLAAAEAVLSPSPERRSALELLEALVDQSLVVTQSRSVDLRRRFRLLHSVRDFAFDRLSLIEPDGLVARRHRAYYAALAERSVDPIDEHRASDGLGRLAAERANLAAALARESTTDRSPYSADRMRLALGLGVLLKTRGTLEESLKRLDLGVCPEPLGRDEARLQIRLQCARSRVFCDLGRFDESLLALDSAAVLAAVAADERLLNRVRVERARALERMGRLGDAVKRANEALEVARDTEERPQQAELLVCLSRCHIERGEQAEALSLADAALATLAAEDCPALEGAACIERARALFHLGREPGEITAAIERAADAFGRADDGPMVMYAHLYHAGVALRFNRPQQVRAIIEPLRPTLRRRGALRSIAFADGLLARAAVEEGRLAEARDLLTGAMKVVRRANEHDVEALAAEALSAVYRAMGKFPAAEDLLRRTLAQSEKLETGEFLASLLSSRLAAVCAVRGRAEAARAALEAAEAVRSEEEAQVLELLRCYAHLEHISDRLAEAAVVDEALKPLRRVLRVEQGSEHHPWGRRTALERSFALRLEVRLLQQQLPPRLVARLDAESLVPEGRALFVAPDTSWFRPPQGQVVDLASRPLMGRLLGHLAKARRSRPAVAQPPEVLFEAGWPGERMLSQSATARLHTSIRRLRKMGLERTLLSSEDGYLLDPEVPLFVVAPT